MMIKIHPDNPSERRIQQVADILNSGGVIIYPTDTVYALACAVDQKGAFEKICRIKQVASSKAKFSMIFEDLSQVGQYAAQITTPHYRLLKKHLPGPFTFVHKASHHLPSHLKAVRKTIGIRIPQNKVSMSIVRALGKPLFTSSLRSGDDILEYYNDPEAIHDEFGSVVDVVIDAGPGTFEPSTIVDLTREYPEVVREGKGVFNEN